MTVVVQPIGAPELVDKLRMTLADLISRYGETDELVEALYLITALRLAVRKP